MRTPWGQSQHVETLMDGVVQVDTAGHGGIGVEASAASKILSQEAMDHGDREYGYYWYEEDCKAAIPIFDNPKLREKFSRVSDEDLLRTLSVWESEYLIAKGVEPTAKPAWRPTK